MWILAVILGLVAFAPKQSKAPAGRVPPCGGYGDVDSDGLVTEADVRAAGEFFGQPVDPANPRMVRADVNGSGFINGSDISAIAAYAAGRIDTFTVCR